MMKRHSAFDRATSARNAALVLAIIAFAFGISAASVRAEQIKAPPSASTEQPLPGLDAVLDDLRKGGLVIFFRHGTTEQGGPSEDAADLNNCSTQRNLSADGREQVAQIGQAFRTLSIPVGNVTTSPYCRCRDTGKLAFGRYTVSNDLYFAINADADRTQKLALALRQMLATAPQAGTNAVIVSHSANLREATGIWPKPEGVAIVFRPGVGGRYEAIARVLPGEWIAAVKPK